LIDVFSRRRPRPDIVAARQAEAAR
jgi:hypothetical protein